MKYDATDEDLPDFLFDKSKLPEPAAIDPRKRAEIAVQAHYPALSEKQRKREERALKRAEREGEGLEDAKVFVKRAKKIQMWDWLLGLEQTFPAMNFRERDFCEVLLKKFRKYTPYGVKWVTEKQFQWLKTIAATYVRLPRQ